MFIELTEPEGNVSLIPLDNIGFICENPEDESETLVIFKKEVVYNSDDSWVSVSVKETPQEISQMLRDGDRSKLIISKRTRSF